VGARHDVARPSRPSQSVEMRTLQYMTRQLARCEEGQDLIEYALLTALISVVAVTSVSAVGSAVLDGFWAVIAAGLSVQ
jgi:Flp pilus assembly pilin Flp